MLKNRYIDVICGVIIILAIGLTILFMNGKDFGITPTNQTSGYDSRLFDSSRVHTIDLQVENWQEFIADAPEEEYVPCTVTIDGETFSQVGLRTKGNNSRRLTTEYGLSRYSLKLEFDHYQKGSYYGLDKLTLDSSFQDNSYMKSFLAYDMMRHMEVPTPLCSYVWVTINSQDWGLFLAIEEPEESFARRNFGTDYGMLYKPDYQSLEAENADVDLRYIDDNPDSYYNIFRNTKFDTTLADRKRLIQSIETLSAGENLDTVVNVDEVLRYFSAQVFVLNLDSYIGSTGHNYYLYEDDGLISILPWDYNLAFGTYSLGSSESIKDPNILINYPINTPWEGKDMMKRPLFHNVMKNDDYFQQYRAYMNQLISEYFESGYYEERLRQTAEMISPYVKKDPTAFCSYEDYLLAAETLIDICDLRTQSIRGQLDGIYPATIAKRNDNPDAGVDASELDIENLGDFEDLENAKERQDKALNSIQ